MKTLVLMLLICTAPALFSPVAQSQEPVLKGRSGLELNFGLWTGPIASTAVGISVVGVEVKSSALVGGLLFTHWVQEYLSVTIGAGLLAGKASSTVNFLNVSQHVSSVIPVLLGVRYYVLGSAAEERVRPYLSAAVGMYAGSEVKNSILIQETRTETTFGGRAGAGLDFFLGDHFKLGASAGYHLMSDFETPIGARKNYNGGEFTIGFGYVF